MYQTRCLATVVDTSLSGHRVARQLDRIAEMRGYPCMVVSDIETELTSNAMLKWQEDRQVEWHYIAPGKPMQNGFFSQAEKPLGWMRRHPHIALTENSWRCSVSSPT